MERAKDSDTGVPVQEIEEELSRHSFVHAKNVQEIDNMYNVYLQHRDQLRNFYYSTSRTKKKRTYELQRRKYIDNLCSMERKYAAFDKKTNPIMFIGDRGYGFGSPIKGHLRCGGHWKPIVHSRYTSICITNEHNTSQTCLFCFSKTSHPFRKTTLNGKTIIKSVNGTSMCYNQDCISVRNGHSHKGRDALSALAIGLTGLASLLLGTPFPAFDPNISQFNTDFPNLARAFLNRNASGPAIDDGNTL